MDYEYSVRRSARRSLRITITPDCQVVIKAPYSASSEQIRAFVTANNSWVVKNLAKARSVYRNMNSIKRLTDGELKDLKNRASVFIPDRVSYYSSIIGVSYGRITIRAQKTRWGSCSAKGNLNFNCLLMLAPPEVLDSVVVHELCHRKHLDHSKEFYEEVLSVFPDYRKWNEWLKQNGMRLMRRMTG